MRSVFALAVVYASACYAASLATVSVKTTSGTIQGTSTDGVSIFKGIRYGQPPTGDLRWQPPVAFTSNATQTANTLPPSCIQQFPFAGAALNELIFNTPAPPESEDCLFLNVWAPTNASNLPVVVWIYGGALAFGTASIAEYDGFSMVKNQGIILASFNYRTNVFGFPGSPDLPLTGNNLGFLDQELVFKWVQNNIAAFGGNPTEVTIWGESAGSKSVSGAISRHTPADAPFRAAIMESVADTSMSPTPLVASFNNFSGEVGCGQTPGDARLACLKKVPASTIRTYLNGPKGASFRPIVDNQVTFADPLQRIRQGLGARVPFIISNNQDDGTLFTIGQDNLTNYLATHFPTVTPAQARALYTSGLSDHDVISQVVKDVTFLCPTGLWSNVTVLAGVPNVFRYSYGAVFADLQVFPNAGAWHSSELREIFGTYNSSTATAAEVTLSATYQKLVADFVKNPTASPAPNWPRYIPGSNTKTLAKLAYNGNVLTSNVVEAVQSDLIDGPCSLWNKFLDFRPT
ncbi:Alpha/Beta hydrolase protein [Roridomyces roridus]|uniref:Carboxylic ester hydrolase n=1 Tax=Roridomyces roridus TaxID=1738132 RepID=A0AAD7FP25_9AGAR|nr:Alpha/Beta hydrolase protein [Roridomyces roridus]